MATPPLVDPRPTRVAVPSGRLRALAAAAAAIAVRERADPAPADCGPVGVVTPTGRVGAHDLGDRGSADGLGDGFGITESGRDLGAVASRLEVGLHRRRLGRARRLEALSEALLAAEEGWEAADDAATWRFRALHRGSEGAA